MSWLREIRRKITANAMSEPQAEDYSRVLTVPNLVTLFGLILNLLYFFSYFYGWITSWIILLLPIGSGISDILDGFLARELKQRSKWGERLDPLRDATLIAAMIGHLICRLGIESIYYPQLAVTAVLEGSIGLGGGLLSLKYQITSHTAGKIRRAIHAGLCFNLLACAYADFPWGCSGLKLLATNLGNNLYATYNFMVIASMVAFWFYAKDAWRVLSPVFALQFQRFFSRP